jgi:glycerol-3-phosphate dehydrogenase
VSWGAKERSAALERLARDGVELAVVGGGITGAGVLRDAALRGISTALFERDDFASGTSSATSKMIHGGLRYIAEGQLGVTRESCVERDLMAKLNPELVWPLPFLFCAFDDGIPPWKMVAGLSVYSALAGFKGGAFKLLANTQVAELSRDVRKQGLRAAGLYYDQQVDDARIVLETIKDARRVGGEAINHAEVTGFDSVHGKVEALLVRDKLTGITHRVRAAHVVNATGPRTDHVRSLDHKLEQHELRPAKGVHVVIPRERVHADAAVAFQAEDRRHVFLCPHGDVHLIGTTDAFTEELDEPQVTATDVRYLLAAANHAFPTAKLEPSDVVSVYAGVRPLVADGGLDRPPSSVSREHRITEDPSGLLSVAGGKLTTYRHMAEQIVDRVVKAMPAERRAQVAPCSTKKRPLRDDGSAGPRLRKELCERFQLESRTADRLVHTWGASALPMLERASVSTRTPIAGSRYLLCEVAWSIEHECALNLCDVLERRVRVAVFAKGQGLTDLDALTGVVQAAGGLSNAQVEDERQRYRARVARRYQVNG